MDVMTEKERLYDEQYKNDTVTVFMNGFREHADRIAYVLSRIKEANPRTILDIGCQRGVFGTLSQWTWQQPRYVTGVDLSRRMCQEALTNGYYKTHMIDADVAFDLRTKFDLVLCMELLEHVERPLTVIGNAFRHAEKKLLFSTPEEHEPVDGKIHVRHVTLAALAEMVGSIMPKGAILETFFLPSLFCEKPRWQGWNYVEVTL